MKSDIRAEISKIDQFGLINIVFSKNMKQPEELKAIIELDAVKFTLIKSNGTKIKIDNPAF